MKHTKNIVDKGSSADGQPSPTFVGPVKDRKCTDCIWLLLLIASWVAMTGVGFAALGHIHSDYIDKGDPWRLIKGVDYQGHICGEDAPVKYLNNIYYPNPGGSDIEATNGDVVSQYFGICVDACPDETTEGDGCSTVSDPYDSSRSWCAVATTEAFHYCLPLGATKTGHFIEDSAADIWTASDVICATGIVGATVFAFAYIFMLRIPCLLRATVWFSLALVETCLAFAAYYAWTGTETELAKDTSRYTNVELQCFRAFAIALMVSCLIWACICVWMAPRIHLAVGIVKEAARAIGSMPSLIWLPLLQTTVWVGFLCVLCYYAIFLASSGTIEATTDEDTGVGYKTVEFTQNAQYALFFLLFCCLWTGAWLDGMGELFVSLSVSRWYFSQGLVTANGVSLMPVGVVGSSFTAVLRHHPGTAALGSFLTAAMRLLTLSLGYIMSRMKRATNGRGGCACLSSNVARVALCCCGCCLWFFDNCLKYVHKQAYIQTSLWGHPFWRAATRAYGLISRNAARVMAVSVITAFVIFVGKCAITITCALVAYYYFTTHMAEDALHDPVVPTLVAAALAFYVVTLFCKVVGTAVDTILQSFITDEECGAGANAAHRELQLLVDSQSERAYRPSVHGHHQYTKEGAVTATHPIHDGRQSVEQPPPQQQQQQGPPPSQTRGVVRGGGVNMV